MKKNKIYSTTEFYKNPSKILGYVKDGEVVYLGYKKLKDPIAVITPYKDYKPKKERISLWKLSSKKSVSAPEYADSLKYIQSQRKSR
ncbi:MAG TPA: hypothetical protein PLA45_03030 [Candidatus Dojkabacteria bacterium]|nr:hypothetical protein [Candidatus Dojkabacteria bacterium]